MKNELQIFNSHGEEIILSVNFWEFIENLFTNKHVKLK